MTASAILITVDVEEDMPDWTILPHISVKNIRALPRFQRICDNFGLRPTYLVTYPMATQPESVTVLRTIASTGKCEIGAHLHPWNTPPLPSGPISTPLRATQLPLPLVTAKLDRLTRTIETAFNVRPRSFRFGRFGVDGGCLQALEALGYLTDSSVTHGLTWVEEGGQDFRHAPPHPYFPSRKDPARKGSSEILEVPVSAGFTRPVPHWLKRFYMHLPRWTHLRGILSNEYTGLLDFIWLSPWGHTAKELIRVADVLLDQGSPALNVFLHSSELFPNSSNCARTTQQVDAYFETLHALFSHVVRARNCRGATLSEFRATYREGGKH